MKKSLGILLLTTIFFACNRNDVFENRGNLIIQNNSSYSVFTEIIEFGDLVASDSIKAGQNLELNLASGHKKVLIFEADNEAIIRDLTVFANKNNMISILSDKVITVVNSQDFPIYFYYQKYVSDQNPLEDNWSAYQLDNQPKLIDEGESTTINLTDGYRYWGSFTTDLNEIPGRNKVRFRVNEDLSPIIL